MAEKEFPKGIVVKLPNANAPEYVIGSLSLHRKELITWLESKSEEWINLGMNKSQGGKPYAFVDTWKPTPKLEEKQTIEEVQSNEVSPPDNLPF